MQFQAEHCSGIYIEAEYIVALEATHEGVWMKEFISDLGVSNENLL